MEGTVDVGGDKMACGDFCFAYNRQQDIHATLAYAHVELHNAGFAGKHTAQASLRKHLFQLFACRLRASVVG